MTVADIRVSCFCGNEMVMSEFAVGMRTTCPACGKPLTISWRNSRPLDSEEPLASVPPGEASEQGSAATLFEGGEPPAPKAGTHYCARCGRAFRGDWDRHETSDGLLCNICVNLVQPVDPSRPASGYVAPIATIRIDRNEDLVPPPSEVSEKGLTWWERHRPADETMQKIALYSGIAVIVLAAAVFVFGGNDAPEPGASSVPGEAAAEPTVTGVAYWIITGITRFFGSFLGLYLFLHWGNRLPNERVVLNLIALAPVVLGVMLLSLIPFGGWIFALILIFTVYGFEWGDLLRLPASGIVARIFEWFLWITLMGILGNLAF